MDKEKLTFEERLERVQTIVNKMEKETLPMEEALRLFEEGNALVKTLQKELADAKAKMQELVGNQ